MNPKLILNHIVIIFLYFFIAFKVDKATFGNIEWLAAGIFVLLYFVAILLATLVDNSIKNTDK